MLCPKCAQENTESSKFCSNCGYQLSAPPTPAYRNVVTKTKALSKKKSRIIGFIFVFIAVGIATSLSIAHNKNYPNNLMEISDYQLPAFYYQYDVTSINGDTPASIHWRNLSGKDFKYIEFQVSLFNQVGDVMERHSTKFIGPIPTNKEEASWLAEFDVHIDTFNTRPELVSFSKLTEIEITLEDDHIITLDEEKIDRIISKDA